MNFSEALEAMKQYKKVKLPERNITFFIINSPVDMQKVIVCKFENQTAYFPVKFESELLLRNDWEIVEDRENDKDSK